MRTGVSTAETMVCTICTKPVLAGQARYTITNNHYDCEFPGGRQAADESFALVSKQMDGALAAFGIKPKRTKAREGTGKTATKAQALAVAAIEKAVGETLFDVTLWNQQGAYRGKHWDLDRWGLFFSFKRDGHVFKGQSSTLATMTQCARSTTLVAKPGGMAFSFEVEPVHAKQKAKKS